MRVTPGFIIAAGLLAMPSAALAQANFSNARLPKLAQVRTLPLPAEFVDPARRGFLHSFRLSVDLGMAITEKRRQPTRLKQNSYGTQLGLSFGISSMGFASVTGNVSRETIKSTILAFPLSLDSKAEAGGADLVLGITPLPFLRVGILGGFGIGNSTYQFVGVAGTPVGADSTSYRFGAFAGASYPVGPVMLSLDATLLTTRSRQAYDPTNIPPVAHFGSTIGMLHLSALYSITPRLRLSGGIILNQVLAEKVAPAERGLDPSWFTLQAGLAYQINRNWEVSIKGMTWLSNQRMNYSRATIGAAYTF
ncbi:hypothetical protein [Rhabdaerophilum sp. SD176]|uniref:hypothetical protein n=1 Tax=Rhabdaerophilum sp. SD176 TaxID=2983548 RepID=UPI0024DFCD81|nr:hypothetical protein [Rhabdaerophilum sp. SD176]